MVQLIEFQVQLRDLKATKLRHYVIRNRFINGEIYAEGRIKPYGPSEGKPLERLQIKPDDFLCERLIPEGLHTTRYRKEFLDSLLTEEGV